MQETGNNINTAYSLSIRLSADGFSFSVYTPSQEDSFNYTQYNIDSTVSLTTNLKNALSNEPLLKGEYQKVNIVICSSRFTVVPLDEFDEKQASKLFKYNFPNEKSSNVLFNILPKNKSVLLFSIDRNIELLIKDHYPNCSIFHQQASVAEHFFDKSFIGNTKKMFVYGHEKHIDIYAFDRGKLLFTNSFVAKEADDCIYFLLFVWKQLAMEQETDEMHIVGQLPNIKHQLEELRKFVRKVYLINPGTEFNHLATAENEDVPYDIKTMLLCN